MSNFGWQGVMSVNASGLSGGSWVEIGNLRSVDTVLAGDEVDVTTRADLGTKTTAIGLQETPITGTLRWRTAHGGFDILRAAWENRTPIGVRVFDANGEGLEALMNVMSIGRSEPIEGEMECPISLKNAPSTTAPVWNVPA